MTEQNKNPWVKRVRKELKYTGNEFAAMLDVARPTLCNYEYGRPMSTRVRQRLIQIAKDHGIVFTLEDTLP